MKIFEEIVFFFQMKNLRFRFISPVFHDAIAVGFINNFVGQITTEIIWLYDLWLCTVYEETAFVLIK